MISQLVSKVNYGNFIIWVSHYLFWNFVLCLLYYVLYYVFVLCLLCLYYDNLISISYVCMFTAVFLLTNFFDLLVFLKMWNIWPCILSRSRLGPCWLSFLSDHFWFDYFIPCFRRSFSKFPSSNRKSRILYEKV